MIVFFDLPIKNIEILKKKVLITSVCNIWESCFSPEIEYKYQN